MRRPLPQRTGSPTCACLTLFKHAERLLFSALSGLSIENGAQTVSVKSQAKAMLLSKSREFRFSPIPVVWPDAAEFFLINSAVFCCLQLALNLLHEFSHLLSLQLVPSV